MSINNKQPFCVLISKIFLVVVLTLGGCASLTSDGGNTGPESDSPPGGTDGSNTPPVAQPSPPIIDAAGQLSNDRLNVDGEVTRPEGESVEGIVVTVTNVNTGESVETTVDGEGNFEVDIDVSEGDLILAQAEDPVTGQESNILSTIVPEGDESETIDVEFVDASTTDYDGDGVDDADDCAPANSAASIEVTQYVDADSDSVRENSSEVTGCTSGSAQSGYTFNQNGPDNCPTAPNSDQADSDGDGAGDVCDADLDWDGDGLNNAEEAALGTDPNDTDTDNDGVSDSSEVAQGRNPTVNEPALLGLINNLLFN